MKIRISVAETTLHFSFSRSKILVPPPFPSAPLLHAKCSGRQKLAGWSLQGRLQRGGHCSQSDWPHFSQGAGIKAKRSVLPQGSVCTCTLHGGYSTSGTDALCVSFHAGFASTGDLQALSFPPKQEPILSLWTNCRVYLHRRLSFYVEYVVKYEGICYWRVSVVQ